MEGLDSPSTPKINEMRNAFPFFYSYVYGTIMPKSIIETHKVKIYPWVKVFFDKDVVIENEVEITNLQFPVYRPWLADLPIFYIADLDDHYQLVLPDDLTKTYSIDDLHRLAVKNLKAKLTYKIHQAEFGGYD